MKIMLPVAIILATRTRQTLMPMLPDLSLRTRMQVG